jgi:hypothetical protein
VSGETRKVKMDDNERGLPVREDISSKLEIPFIPTLYPLHTSLYNRR